MKKSILVLLALIILAGCSYKIVKNEVVPSNLQNKMTCSESADKYFNDYLLKMWPGYNSACPGQFSIIGNTQQAYSKTLDTCVFYYDLGVGSKDENCKVLSQQFNREIIDLASKKEIYYYREYQTEKMDKMIPTDCTGDNKCLNSAEFDKKLKELFGD